MVLGAKLDLIFQMPTVVGFLLKDEAIQIIYAILLETFNTIALYRERTTGFRSHSKFHSKVATLLPVLFQSTVKWTTVNRLNDTRLQICSPNLLALSES